MVVVKYFYVSVILCPFAVEGELKFYVSVILCPFAVEGELKTEKTQKLRHPFRGWVLQRTLLRAVMYGQ